MGNLRERKIPKGQDSKVGREKVTDEPSIYEIIDEHGGHVKGDQLGNMANAELKPPLTEQEKRNRAMSSAPDPEKEGGEAAVRAAAGEAKAAALGNGPRPSAPAADERIPEDITTQRPSRPNDQYETRPTHP
jgi:hypothetical protein